MTWDEFVQKLTDAKKQKKTKGLSVPTLTLLIYSGAFDEMVGDFEGKRPEKYTKMYQDVKKALKSKAALPAKKKDDIYSISQITSESQLLVWRHQVNPTTQFSFVEHCEMSLKNNGYNICMRGWLEATKQHVNSAGNHLFETLIAGDWSKIPEDNNHPIIRDLLSGRRHLGAIGVITSVSKVSYYNNDMQKEMMKINLFNGHGHIQDLIVWPEENGKVNSFMQIDAKKGTTGIIDVRVSINKKNGRRSYSVHSWHSFASV